MEYFAHKQKEFIYKYVVMLADADQFKHMSFANYLRLMFLAADAFFVSSLSQGFADFVKIKNINSRLQFKSPTTIGDHVVIKVNSCELTGNRFSLLFTFVKEETADLVALGRQDYEKILLDKLYRESMENEFHPALKLIEVDENNMLYKY